MNIKIQEESKSLLLELTLEDNEITSALCSNESKEAKTFCEVLVGMTLADAAYYAAKITLEKMQLNSAKGISFASHHPTLNLLDKLIKKAFDESELPDSSRFVNKFSAKWAKLDFETQKSILSDHIDSFFGDNSLYQPGMAYISHKGLSISVDLALFIPKANIQKTLVRLEKFIRENLEGTPVILLVEERKDANTKRR
ncbi:hypothetical protein PALB_6000 [Pseudoalteromonas luteoviolacea B = ATCC 29581]|nr:hypothetical protein PALB_6000 [Pseudoalteromonas luteoviolacea B = ATCC 29581]